MNKKSPYLSIYINAGSSLMSGQAGMRSASPQLKSLVQEEINSVTEERVQDLKNQPIINAQTKSRW